MMFLLSSVAVFSMVPCAIRFIVTMEIPSVSRGNKRERKMATQQEIPEVARLKFSAKYLCLKALKKPALPKHAPTKIPLTKLREKKVEGTQTTHRHLPTGKLDNHRRRNRR